MIDEVPRFKNLYTISGDFSNDSEKATRLSTIAVFIRDEKEIPKNSHKLPEREFENRESLLTELFQNNQDTRSVINIIILFFTIFVVTVLGKELFYNTRIPPPLMLIYKTFGKLHIGFAVWIINNITTISIYFGFLFWEKTRRKAEKKKLWDNFCIISLLSYFILSFCTLTVVVTKFNLPFGTSMILCMESVRFLMKIYAFVRANAEKVLKRENETENLTTKTLSLIKFLYFLFVPTAVYKDEYPRSPSIRWSFVIYRALEILAVIFFYASMIEYLAVPLFKDTCITKMSLLDIVIKGFQFSIPCVIMIWGIFFVLIHSSQNLMGELLRFGDRMFYSDWWTATDIQQFYKKWNMVIGDWLYTYIYKDISENVAQKPINIYLSKCIAVMLSACAHDWVVTTSCGFFMPLSLIGMGISALMDFKVTSRNNWINLIALSLMTLASACSGVLYSTEYFARKNLNSTNFTLLPLFLTENCLAFDLYPR